MLRSNTLPQEPAYGDAHDVGNGASIARHKATVRAAKRARRAIDRAELDRRLTPRDRAALFRKLGIDIPLSKENTAEWINGLKLPSEIHDDTNASVSVDLATGAIIDHGGHFSGDLYKLVQREQRCTFPEALEWVATEIGYAGAHSAPNRRPEDDTSATSPDGSSTVPKARHWDPFEDGREAAVYVYTGEQGTRLFDVVRFEVRRDHEAYPDKTFRQRLPGARKYGIGDTRRVLYRLPHVIAAAAAGDTVYIVEGEKDADALKAWDLVVTTNPGGAGKWSSEYADDLRGAHVVILPDNDDAGEAHAKAVARSVAGSAASVRIVRLPGLAPKGDVSDWIAAGGTPDELQQLVSDTQPYLASVIFWFRDKKGKLRIDQNAFIRFLESEGFGKIYLPGVLRSQFVRLEGNVMDEVSTETIKDFTLARIDAVPDVELDDDRDALRGAMIRGANTYFGRGGLECLRPLQPAFKQDTRAEAFFYYANGFVRVTGAGIELLDYSELHGVVWGENIHDRAFTLIDDFDGSRVLESDFGRFLWNICTDQEEARRKERFKSLCSAIGYLLHRFKNRSVARAIVFVDEGISDVPEGRTGKSLVGAALGHIIPTVRIDGRNFRFDSQFAFQSVGLNTAVVEFNDVSENFDFERLYSIITDDMPVEKKYRDQFFLPFETSPKFLVSTNYTLEGEGGSHEDRIFEIEFSDHYNPRHKPFDDFRQYFFEDWDADQWNRLDNMMLHCVQVYLLYGLHPYAHVNLPARKLRQQTAPEFLEFMEDVKLGVAHNKKELHARFVKAYADFEKMQQRTMTMWIKKYAKPYGLVVKEDRGRGGAERTIVLTKPDLGDAL